MPHLKQNLIWKDPPLGNSGELMPKLPHTPPKQNLIQKIPPLGELSWQLENRKIVIFILGQNRHPFFRSPASKMHRTPRQLYIFVIAVSRAITYLSFFWISSLLWKVENFRGGTPLYTKSELKGDKSGLEPALTQGVYPYHHCGVSAAGFQEICIYITFSVKYAHRSARFWTLHVYEQTDPAVQGRFRIRMLVEHCVKVSAQSIQ